MNLANWKTYNITAIGQDFSDFSVESVAVRCQIQYPRSHGTGAGDSLSVHLTVWPFKYPAIEKGRLVGRLKVLGFCSGRFESP